MTVFDCFLYNGEFKMLNFRLHELNDLVDYFVIGESEYTFKGDKRTLVFPAQRPMLEKFSDKIIYVRHTQRPLSDPWDNERDQRNNLQLGLQIHHLKDSDLIMLSDVDEIPDTAFLAFIRKTGFWGIGVSYQNFHYYNFKCRNVKKWPGTVFFNCGSGYLKLGFEQLRKNRLHLPKVGCDGDYTSGGWHFSYFGDAQFIIDKIKSFAHQEYNRPEFTDPEVIEECIKSGKDLFFRKGEKFELVENQSYLPKFISLLS